MAGSAKPSVAHFMKHLFRILLLSLPAWVARAEVETQKFATQYSLTNPAVPMAARAHIDGKPWLGKERGPVEGLMVFAQEKSGAVWLGSDQGAARFDRKASHKWDRWQYFHGR